MSVSFQLGKLLVVVGVVLVGLGLLLMAGGPFSFFGLGQLPGDIAYKSKNVSFHFPIVSSLIVSVVLTVILWLISYFSRR